MAAAAAAAPTSLPLPPLRLRPPTTSLLLLHRRATSVASSPIPFKPQHHHPNDDDGSGFVEVGYVCNFHGLQGELRVKPSTDFPQLRFQHPGPRWLRARETVTEVELTSGRAHPGSHNLWIITLKSIDTIDKAKQLVGSTLLVKEDDRPQLEDGDFYSRDLIGMQLILKESGMPVGTVVNVINFGANDLLQVMLHSPQLNSHSSSSTKTEINSSGSLVWVPFVEAIVPDVDMENRVMQITPPKGLLELNLRSGSMSKKERSKLEWKQKKKFQQRVIATKKKLIELGQKHALQGFCFGEKTQKGVLANQIVDINFKLLLHAMKSTDTSSFRYGLSELLNIDGVQKSSFEISQKCLTTSRNDEETEHSVLLKNGFDLLSGSKVAIVLVVNGNNEVDIVTSPDYSFNGKHASPVLQLQELLLSDKSLLKIDGKVAQVPLVIVSPLNEVQLYEELFSNNDHFGFEPDKVWFLEEAKLPVLNSLLDEQSTRRILLKSPWEIHQTPIGSGGILSVLSSHKVLDNFEKWGIELVQVCTLVEAVKENTIGHPMLFGWTSTNGKDVGIKQFDSNRDEDVFNIVFSVKYLKETINHLDKLKFSVICAEHEHVEFVDNEWVGIRPSASNSICFRSSIYSLFDASDADKICLLHITD